MLKSYGVVSRTYWRGDDLLHVFQYFFERHPKRALGALQSSGVETAREIIPNAAGQAEHKPAVRFVSRIVHYPSLDDREKGVGHRTPATSNNHVILVAHRTKEPTSKKSFGHTVGNEAIRRFSYEQKQRHFRNIPEQIFVRTKVFRQNLLEDQRSNFILIANRSRLTEERHEAPIVGFLHRNHVVHFNINVMVVVE